MNKSDRDITSPLPDFRTVVKTDASFRRDCGIFDALRAEWAWPDAPTRGAYAKWLVAWLAKQEAAGRKQAGRSAEPRGRAVSRSA